MKRCSADGLCLSSCRDAGGLVDAGTEYEKDLAEEITKLQRLYGGGDLTAFPEFKFTGESSSSKITSCSFSVSSRSSLY